MMIPSATSPTTCKSWKHNGIGFFDSQEIIERVATENALDLEGTSLFYLRSLRNGVRRRTLEPVVARAFIREERAPTFQEAS